jgi:hypothetical protein
MKLLYLCVALLGLIGCSQAFICNQSSNVYWFGSGLEDPGNWLELYGSGRTWDTPFGQINNPTVFYPPPVDGPGIIALGAQSRFADGYISPDFVAQTYGLQLSAAEELGFIPPGFGNLVCFGISGSTAGGNLYNSFLSNRGYDETTGNGGYNHQVDRFLFLQSQPPSMAITPNDVFIYGSVFADDILGIFNDWTDAGNDNDNDGVSDAFNSMFSAGTTTIQNLQNLADAGAKRFIISVVDPESAFFLPILVKVAPCTSDVQDFVAWLLSIMDECLYNRLEAFQFEYDVEVNIVYYSDILNSVFSNYPSTFGVRTPLCNDLDPRTQFCDVDCADVPFPTFMDTYFNSEGSILLYNTPWFDDLHITSLFHKRVLAPVYINYLAAMNLCQ